MLREKCAPCQWRLQSASWKAWLLGRMLEVIGEGELEFDNIQRWVKNNGHEVVETSKNGAEFKIVIRKH